MRLSSKIFLLPCRKITLGNKIPLRCVTDVYSSVDGKGPAVIVDVRCSSQYSKSEDTQGSESAQRLTTLQKQKKQIQNEIEMIKSKEDLLKQVLVAYAASDNFNFTGGMDMYDEKKIEAKVKREELEDELAAVEKKIREVGPNTIVNLEHQVTGSAILFRRL
jgi:hypothetical protein